MINDFNTSILLESLKKGDTKAYERVYKAYYGKLCQYALSYTRDRAKIEDIVQETFIALWTKRQEINIKTSLKVTCIDRYTIN